MSTIREKWHAVLSIQQTPGYPFLPIALLRLIRLFRSYDEGETLNFIERFARDGNRITIFITGTFLERNFDWTLRLQTLGCEIGLHGYHHLSPNRMPPRQFEVDLQKCIQSFERAGIQYRGYRAPNLAFPSSFYPILKKLGIRYSSSLLCSGKAPDLMEQCIDFMDVPMIFHDPGREEIRKIVRQYFKTGNILCLHPYGLLGTVYGDLTRQLLLDTGLRTITIAEKVDGGEGLCLSIDFGT